MRDNESFWLSSGNWQSSNQLAESPEEFDGTLAQVFARHNREWHVVVDSPKLAKVYGEFLEFDLTQSAKVQDDGPGPGIVVAELPQLFVLDDDDAERGAADLATFPQESFGGDGDGVRIQAMLSPDNYAEEVLEQIRKAKKTLYFQNQYLKIGKVVAPMFKKLLDALMKEVNELDDAAIILRKLPGAREMVEVLIARRFRPDRIRLMTNTHTKGIVFDSKGGRRWQS